ncbi:ABC transporter substrate-binding protein [Rhizosaccharibacter radicis]|uniref:ABC transporter substrate-binding protein n=1 Tax=Rhizosaccharibacter radicis TaxID=2782605 RepID=A0ABT1VX42_9PROT|nr:ABC transporter substrate-binding protein [Acetobacteraceae bacterium KSS12]
MPSAMRVLVVLGALLATCPALAANGDHRGGTLRITADAGAGTIDPQINYFSEMIQVQVVVYDGLTAFSKHPGEASNHPVADLADALPEPQDGGRTYVFHLRDGIRFSDGRAVTVDDVVASFRRIFKVHAPSSGSFYAGIVGASDCLKDAEHCTLPGVQGDAAARTVTFHLTAPDAEFLDKLAFPHAYVLPADTPPHDLGNDPAPGTGPYRFVSYDSNRGMVLDRNPFFHEWNAEAQPDGYVDRIEYSFGLDDEAEVTAVENGQFDTLYDNVPLDRYGEIGDRYTDQVHIEDVFALYYLAMNVNLPPFNNLKARQAVNYAVNRRAMQTFYGGEGAASIACQYIPAGLPGHVPYCPYSRGADNAHPVEHWAAPDLARARQLVAESGTEGQHVTLVVPNRAVEIAMGTNLQNMLRAIGYDADVKPIAFAIQFNYIQNSSNKVQISLTDWFADFARPSNFVSALYGCGNFHPGSDSSPNVSGYCTPALEDVMNRAMSESLADPARGDALWAQADRMLSADAPGAPLIQIKKIDLVSKRLGHYTATNLYHMLFSQVWVR